MESWNPPQLSLPLNSSTTRSLLPGRISSIFYPSRYAFGYHGLSRGHRELVGDALKSATTIIVIDAVDKETTAVCRNLT